MYDTLRIRTYRRAIAPESAESRLDFFSNKEDAEDVAQETMVQLWRYLEHIDAERNVEALAVRVAKNCCVSMYRRQSGKADTIDIDRQADNRL
jgi:RNA polymerase sigma factor (sigma-70 family)